MSEVVPEEIVPDIGELLVAAHVPEEVGEDQEVNIEMSLDNNVVLILAFPNNGQRVDRDAVRKLFATADLAWPQILDQMEAPA